MNKRRLNDVLGNMKTTGSNLSKLRIPWALTAGWVFLASCGWGFSLSGQEPDVRRDASVKAIEKVMPCVVNIVTKTRVVERRGYFFDWWRENWSPFVQELPPQASAGSGVIVDEDGYVLTNVHVVEGADEVWVKLMDDSPLLRAEPIVGARRTDVALLRLRGKPGQKFKAAKFAADDDLLLGETVLALGNPFGLGGSVSRGILSSKSRRESSDGERALEVPDWLQTDAAINPGNSGGPLINLRGEVIGINVAMYRQGQGIGFAIPSKKVSEALAQIFTPEWIKQLWFGARIRPSADGLLVAEVVPGSPAERAGLKTGDRVVRVDDKSPRSLIELNQELVSADAQRDVIMEVQRGGARSKLKVRLVPKKSVFNSALIQQKLGVVLQPVTPELVESLGLGATEGFVVSSVDRNSPAAEAGLQPSHVIQGVDGRALETVMDLAEVLYAKKPGEKVSLSLITQRRRGAYLELRRGTVEVSVR
jgi:serine protease Do